MRPAQLGTQCVSNWKCLKKSTHVAKIPPIKPLPELLCQRRRQTHQESLAVGCTRFSALPKFHDVPPHLPAGLYFMRSKGIPVGLGVGPGPQALGRQTPI